MRALATAVGILGMGLPVWGQTLLGGDSGSPYDPARQAPIRKHDHIQIIVIEKLKAVSTQDLRKDRRSRWEVDLDQWFRLQRNGRGFPSLKGTPLTGDPGIDLDARYRQDNLGRTSRNTDLVFMISAEVIDIRPNGNLVIQAKKRRKINADEEILLLTGEVSPRSLVNNTVRSEKIANLDIRVTGHGPASDVTKPGWLGWLLDKLWPF